MAGSAFDLLVVSRRKIAALVGPSPTQQQINKTRLRLVQEVYNNRRLVYRNRTEFNRQNLLLSTIERTHRREEATQRVHKHQILTDLKQTAPVVDSSCLVVPVYEAIDLTEPKDFYRFGVRVHSAAPHIRSRQPGTRSNLACPNRDKNPSRAKSASTTARPFTAPLRARNQDYIEQEDSESDDEAIPVDISRVTSAKTTTTTADQRLTVPSNSTFSALPSDYSFEDLNTSSSNAPQISNHRITWPVKIRVFALQDEDEARQKFLAWRADQRKAKPRRSSKQFVDLELEKKYQTSVRRRKELESFLTPELIEEHQLNDPVFAKRYRQLKLAVRAGKTPTYDPTDREIHVTMNKAKIERARTALITAKQNKIKNFYREQQQMNDAQLAKRIDVFIERLNKFKLQQQQQESEV